MIVLLLSVRCANTFERENNLFHSLIRSPHFTQKLRKENQSRKQLFDKGLISSDVLYYRCSTNVARVMAMFLFASSLKLPRVCLLGPISASGGSNALRCQRVIDKVVWWFMLSAYIMGKKIWSARRDFLIRTISLAQSGIYWFYFKEFKICFQEHSKPAVHVSLEMGLIYLSDLLFPKLKGSLLNFKVKIFNS